MKLEFEYQGYYMRPTDESYKDLQDAGLKSGDMVELDWKGGNPGSQSILNTWLQWMGETAAFMSARGVKMDVINVDGTVMGTRAFNKDDAHDLFSGKYLGKDEKGRRKTWKRCSPDSDEVQASKGDRVWCMNSHLVWATERGVKLTIPTNSEFNKLQREPAA